MKLKEWLEIWLNKYVKHTVKLRTFIRYTEICEKHIIPMFGEYELSELSSTVLQDFVVYKLEKGNLINGQVLSVNSVSGIVSVLKQALNEAFALGIVDKIYVSSIRMPLASEKKVSAFERQEQQVIERFCLDSSKSNYIGIIICLYTGIRLGELLALTWEDVDFERKILNINKTAFTVKRNGTRVVIVDTPKTKSSIRSIPLSSQLIRLLKAKKKHSESTYILSTKTNGMVAERSYQRTFASILRRCNIPYKNFHSLRHTFATRALECGMDVKTLSEILGHRNATITLNRYSHSLMSYKAEMMNKLGKMLD